MNFHEHFLKVRVNSCKASRTLCEGSLCEHFARRFAKCSRSFAKWSRTSCFAKFSVHSTVCIVGLVEQPGIAKLHSIAHTHTHTSTYFLGHLYWRYWLTDGTHRVWLINSTFSHTRTRTTFYYWKQTVPIPWCHMTSCLGNAATRPKEKCIHIYKL